MISPYVLPKIEGSAARGQLVSRMRFDAARWGKRSNWLHKVVAASADLDAEVERYLGEILSAAPSGVAASKAAHSQGLGARTERIKWPNTTSRAIASQRVSPEGQEGLKAFLSEEAKPGWVSKP